MQEKPDGKVAELWQSKLDASGLGTTDVASGFAAVFAVKDKDEIQNIRRSGYLSATVLRQYAVPHLESGFLLPPQLLWFATNLAFIILVLNAFSSSRSI